MTGLNLNFVFEKETKGAVRYKEVDEHDKPAEDYKIGTIYIRKSAFKGELHPSSFTITLEFQGG